MVCSRTGLAGCFDAYYYRDYAKACCVVFQAAPKDTIISEYTKIVDPIAEYIPGEFYKRELPCLLSVYEEIKENLDLVIVDGFVFLPGGKKGLGAHFFDALGSRTPVIGVAKTYFRGVTQCIRVNRGTSRRPLYVSSIGVEPAFSAEFVKKLDGNNRIPNVLKRVDALTRENTGAPAETSSPKR